MVQPLHPTSKPNTPRPPPPPPPPKLYSRASWRPSAIGLAISPTHSRRGAVPITPVRRMSKLLPAKPVMDMEASRRPSTPLEEPSMLPPLLRLVHPSPPSSRSKPPPPAPPKLQIPKQEDFGKMMSLSKLGREPRESTMTEFEEDGRASQSPEGQIWRIPSAAPQSGTAYYVADKQGNWVLADSKRASHAAELDTVTPMTATTPKASIAKPVLLPIYQKAQKVEAKSPRLPEAPKDNIPAPIETEKPAEPPQLTSPEFRQQAVPRPLFSTYPNPRSFSNPERSSTQSQHRARADSADSGITAITASSMDEDAVPPPTAPPQVNLSPVAESPRSVAGRSPVSYPKIHGRDKGPSAAGRSAMAAAPRRSILHRPSGQPSPTLGPRPQPPEASGSTPYSVPRPVMRGIETQPCFGRDRLRCAS